MPSFPPGDGCAAIVVAYRSASTVGACLRSLARDPAVHEVVVVDNSSDRTTARIVDQVRNAFAAELTYVDPGRNVGFAAACNLGIATSRAATIALVNPDVRLARSLGHLSSWLSTAPRSIVAGGLVGPGGVLQNARRESTAVREIRRALLGSPPPVPVPLDDQMHRVDQVDGALLLFERGAVAELGGLAETFPLYFEDVELCWRFRRAAGDVFIHAAEYGAHEGGVSSGQNPRAYLAFRVSRQRWLRLRNGISGSFLGLVLTTLELVTRTAGRGPEGLRARWSAVAVGARELLRPGSASPLG